MSDRLAFSAQSRFFERSISASQDYEKWQLAGARSGAFGAALGGLTGHLTLVVVVATGLRLVAENRLDWINLAVLALVTLASFEAVQPLSQAAQQLETALEAGRRLFALADRPAPVLVADRPLEDPVGRELIVRGLGMSYPGGTENILSDIDLDIKAGKRVAVVGPSGAGKSSLAGVLARLYEYQAGAVKLDGEEIRGYDPQAVRRVIGYALQPVYLFSESLRSNLTMDRAEIEEERMQAVLQAVGLEGLLRRLPGGLDGQVGSQGEQLSGGERQRLALARALLSPARILILDEPTAGLDAPSAAVLLTNLEEISRGRGLCLITHRLAGLEWMDEIVVLAGGRVVDRGTHSDLLAAGGWYRRALRLQNRVLRDGEL
jgi:ABC-type transport system involved in cytochrome bd biosynthesis fused ATPase/permease subunit